MSREFFVRKTMDVTINVSDEEIEDYELDTEDRLIDYVMDVARDIPSYHWENDGDYEVVDG
jgi:hypothetical protein